jgi:uncharacterized protein YqjF (DUF2071 family)
MGEGVEGCAALTVTSIFDQAAHRPWPPPPEPWIMAQSWHDLLFAHWPVEPAIIRPHIPTKLEIDTFEGRAWLGIVPFSMTGVRLRCTPPLPWLSAFPELNVRTYVTIQDKPGVWFFSLDAANVLAVIAARLSFHLPYFYAHMNCQEAEGWIQYESQRSHRGAPSADFAARYRSTGAFFEPRRGTLAHFLTERYCLYSAASEGRLYRGEIHHPPWRLQPAEAQFARNSMAEAAGLVLPDEPPVLHFSRRQEMVAWAPHRIV